MKPCDDTRRSSGPLPCGRSKVSGVVPKFLRPHVTTALARGGDVNSVILTGGGGAVRGAGAGIVGTFASGPAAVAVRAPPSPAPVAVRAAPPPPSPVALAGVVVGSF